MPALFTKTSRRPNSSTTVPTAATTSSAAALSALMASPRLPCALMTSTTSSARCFDCAYVIATSEPSSASRAAIAAPDPPAPASHQRHLANESRHGVLHFCIVRQSWLRPSSWPRPVSAALEPRLADLDPVLLGHTMLSFAEMLGPLAVNDPGTYPRERLEAFAAAALGIRRRC